MGMIIEIAVLALLIHWAKSPAADWGSTIRWVLGRSAPAPVAALPAAPEKPVRARRPRAKAAA